MVVLFFKTVKSESHQEEEANIRLSDIMLYDIYIIICTIEYFMIIYLPI